MCRYLRYVRAHLKFMHSCLISPNDYLEEVDDSILFCSNPCYIRIRTNYSDSGCDDVCSVHCHLTAVCLRSARQYTSIPEKATPPYHSLLHIETCLSVYLWFNLSTCLHSNMGTWLYIACCIGPHSMHRHNSRALIYFCPEQLLFL